MTGPYAAAAPAYWQAGWRGILPLPARKKKLPPKGFTGGDGVDPSYPDIQTWIDGPEGAGNIALRMPPTVIGIDIDDYDDKAGGNTITDAERRWGPLPATWRTTSRDDGISGIRLFRVPEGLAWPHVVGESVEIIRHSHRYAVVWPSVHPEGRTYRWIDARGLPTTVVPDADSLPTLPPAWVEGLTGGELAGDVVRNSLDDVNAGIWLATRPAATDAACARMTKATTGAVDELRLAAASAHDTACAATSRVIRLAAEGHRGLAGALADIRAAFLANVTHTRRPTGRRRTLAEADREWRNLVTSGVNLVTAGPSGPPSCDCDGGLTALVVGGHYPTAGTAALEPVPYTPVDPTQPDTQPDRDRTTWWPRNLAAVLTGHDEEPAPTILTRDDDACLFYPGKVNGLLGESESGKTWVALLAVAQTLRAGHDVVYLDFEDTAPGIVSRLRALTVPDTDLTRLHYIGPEETLHAAANDDLRDTIHTTRPALIVLDGFNAAMTLLGLDINDNGDATKFAQLLLRPLSGTGAAVVYVDHVPKNKDARGKGGIGAQAKRAMTTGAALTVEVLTEFGRGMTGRLRLTVDKDRPGHVRAVSAEAKRAGVAVLVSDKTTGTVTVTIEAPDRATVKEKQAGRRLMLMEAVSDYLATEPARRSQRGILEAVNGTDAEIKDAVAELIRRGFVRQEKVANGFDHHLDRAFTVADELSSTGGAAGAAGCGGRVVPPHPDEAGEVVRRVGASRSAHHTAAPPDVPPSHTTLAVVDGVIVDALTGEVVE